METVFSIVQVTTAVLLVIAILLQRSSAGIEGGIGGGSSSIVVKRKRRGFEKFIFDVSIALTVLLMASLILPLIVQ